MSTKEVTSKDSGIFTDKIAGRLDWNMSTDGLLSYSLTVDDTGRNSIDDIYTLMNARQLITVVFASKTGTSPDWTVNATAPAKSWSGKGFITALEQSTDIDSGTYSITIDGSGALTMA